jgi:hypothetical protein
MAPPGAHELKLADTPHSSMVSSAGRGVRGTCLQGFDEARLVVLQPDRCTPTLEKRQHLQRAD